MRSGQLLKGEAIHRSHVKRVICSILRSISVAIDFAREKCIEFRPCYLLLSRTLKETVTLTPNSQWSSTHIDSELAFNLNPHWPRTHSDPGLLYSDPEFAVTSNSQWPRPYTDHHLAVTPTSQWLLTSTDLDLCNDHNLDPCSDPDLLLETFGLLLQSVQFLDELLLLTVNGRHIRPNTSYDDDDDDKATTTTMMMVIERRMMIGVVAVEVSVQLIGRCCCFIEFRQLQQTHQL